MLLHFMTMEYITSNKGGRKLAFENNISIKQKVLSNGTVWGGYNGGILSRGILSGGFCPGGFCPRTYFYPRCTFILLRSGRREGLDADLASSLELKSVVSSPNKRKKNLKFWYHKEAKIGPDSREREYYYYHTKFSEKNLDIYHQAKPYGSIKCIPEGPPPGNLGRG